MIKNEANTKIEHILIGHIGVDSGTVIIGDPGNLGDFVNDDFTGKADPEQEQFDFSYSGAVQAALADGDVIGEFLHIPGAGKAVASATAHGDGIYPVFHVVEDGKLVGLFIDFTP
jgi:hypothetical protein